MPIWLKSKILGITKSLRAMGKHRLAGCIEANWHKTALAYSKELNFWRPKQVIERELLNAFEDELARLGHDKLSREEILNSLKKRRVIQTAPHLCATQGPRMLCINWLGSLGVPEKEFYLVGLFSGIPFSNRFRPGRINRKSSSVNLFPSSLQDGLVYRSKITAKLPIALEQAPDRLTRLLPLATVGESYTKWAIQACENIERKILGKKNLVFLDINEVTAGYLIRVLRNRFHWLHKIFFNPKARAEFKKMFPGEIMFYARIMNGKYEEMDNLVFSQDKLKGKRKTISLDNSKILIQELEKGAICPGLLLTFIVLSFSNQFKCLGSFAQVEYLPVYQEKLAQLSFLNGLKIKSVATANLTTGLFLKEKDVFPADLIIRNEKLKPDKNMLFGELLIGMKDTLLSSYFTGATRNSHNEKK